MASAIGQGEKLKEQLDVVELLDGGLQHAHTPTHIHTVRRCLVVCHREFRAFCAVSKEQRAQVVPPLWGSHGTQSKSKIVNLFLESQIETIWLPWLALPLGSCLACVSQRKPTDVSLTVAG